MGNVPKETLFVPIEQGLAHYGPRPLPAFMSKVLLEHSHARSLHIIYGCFHIAVADLKRYNGHSTAHEA